jgi:hypothetical protein
MNQTSTLDGHLARSAHCLDRLDDRLLADIGLERQDDLITGAGGRLVHRSAKAIGFERALGTIFSAVHGGLARPAD